MNDFDSEQFKKHLEYVAYVLEGSKTTESEAFIVRLIIKSMDDYTYTKVLESDHFRRQA